MRPFMRPVGIERLSLEARVLYTCFAVFMLVGYATALWFYLDDGLGFSAESTKTYYLGETSSSEPADGPALDLPTEGAPLRFEKPPRQVVETFHFHLFSIPVVLLIVAHLYMMCGLSTRTKVTVIIVAHLATFIHILVPPLVRFLSPGFAFLMFPSAVVMGLSWFYLTVWPVWEMWRPGSQPEFPV